MALILKSGTSGNLGVIEADGSLRTTVVATPVAVRTPLQIFGDALAVGGSGAETLLTLSQVKGMAAGSGASYTITAGKKLVIQSLVFTQVGNTVATTATSTLRIRHNPSGPATVASPVVLQTRLAAPATALSFTQVPLTFPDGWELTGDGNASIAFTVSSTYVVLAPTADVLLVGYEF